MSIEQPEPIAGMEVCPDCRDVVGWFQGRGGAGPLLQRGNCVRHPPWPDAPRWPRYDFNREIDLCQCCGIEPLRSGSKWSVWFCEACKQQVGLLNGRHGRCIVPIGRHSVHWGFLLAIEDHDDPIIVQSFADSAKAAVVAMAALTEWHAIAVGLNLEAIGAASGAPTPLHVYRREALARVEPMDRFREMCAHLDRRGREMPASPGG